MKRIPRNLKYLVNLVFMLKIVVIWTALGSVRVSDQVSTYLKLSGALRSAMSPWKPSIAKMFRLGVRVLITVLTKSPDRPSNPGSSTAEHQLHSWLSDEGLDL